jgi:hypothetical protein
VIREEILVTPELCRNIIDRMKMILVFWGTTPRQSPVLRGRESKFPTCHNAKEQRRQLHYFQHLKLAL